MRESQTETAPGITIVVVTHARPVLLEKMLKSIRVATSEAEKNQFSFETKILLNGKDPETEKIISDTEAYEKIEDPVSPAAARNLLLNKTNKEWLFFVDDDVEIPQSLFLDFKKLITDHPEIDIWGGPNITPNHSSYEQLRNGWMLSDKLITGPVARRYKRNGKEFTEGGQFNLMLCNLFVKRKILDERVFLPFLKTAEENELIYRLKAAGYKLAASDKLYVFHERRSDADRFLKQIFYYGYGRGQLLVNVSIAKQAVFVMLPLAWTLAMGIFVRYPALLLMWLAAIKLKFVIKFKKIDLAVLIMPVAMWFYYLAGMAKGVFVSLAQTAQSKKTNEKLN